MKSRSFRVVLVAVPIAVLAALVFATAAGAQAGFPGGTYSQDFNTLANTGTSSTVPTGWAFNETGSGGNTTYAADNGSSSTANTRSYGTTNSTDRAFGALDNSSGQPASQVQSTIGVQFQNNAGRPIGSLAISYACEQWRLGASGTADQMNFQYSTNATSLTTGTWTNVAGLNCVSKVTAAPSDSRVGRKCRSESDGNLATNHHRPQHRERRHILAEMVNRQQVPGR